MKRYRFVQGSSPCCGHIEHSDGEWVRHSEVQNNLLELRNRLKELYKVSPCQEVMVTCDVFNYWLDQIYGVEGGDRKPQRSGEGTSHELNCSGDLTARDLNVERASPADRSVASANLAHTTSDLCKYGRFKTEHLSLSQSSKDKDSSEVRPINKDVGSAVGEATEKSALSALIVEPSSKSRCGKYESREILVVQHEVQCPDCRKILGLPKRLGQ